MKPIMLAFRPDTTDIPQLFSHAIHSVDIDESDFLEVQRLLQNELKSYFNICAVNNDNQEDRLEVIGLAEAVGFDAIELDEQLSRDTLTVEQFNELKSHTRLPIGVTSVCDPIVTFIRNGARPSFVCVECYDFLPNPDYVKSNIQNIPVYGVINFADLEKESTKPENLRQWSKEVWLKWDGIWFWGWKTVQFEKGAQQNYPIVKELVQSFHSHVELSGIVVVIPIVFTIGKWIYDFFRDVFKEEEG